MVKRWQNIKHRCMNNNKMVLFVFYAAATLNYSVFIFGLCHYFLDQIRRLHHYCEQIRLNFHHTVSVYRV